MKIKNIYPSKYSQKKSSHNTSFQSKYTNPIKNNNGKMLKNSLEALSVLGITSCITLGSLFSKKELLLKIKDDDFKSKYFTQDEMKKHFPKVTEYLKHRPDNNFFALDESFLGIEEDFIIKLMEWKRHDDTYRFVNIKQLKNIIQTYKSNPKRTLELLEEKYTEPYENVYMHNDEFISAIIEAEKIDKNLAERFENIKLPNGLKRFHGEQILMLVENYNFAPKGFDIIINTTDYDGMPYFKLPAKDQLLDFAKSFEDCPQLLDLAQENENQFIISPKSFIEFSSAYQIDPEYSLHLLGMSNKNGGKCFLANDLKPIVESHVINPKLTEELLSYEDKDGHKYLDGDDIYWYVNLYKSNPEGFNEIIKHRDTYGNFRITGSDSILNYFKLKQLNEDLFNQLLNKKNEDGSYIYDMLEISGIFDLYKDFETSDVDFCLNLKNNNNKNKLSIHQIFAILKDFKSNPESKEDFMNLLTKPSVDAGIIFHLQSIQQGTNNEEYKKTLAQINKVVEYIENKQIKPILYRFSESSGKEVIVEAPNKTLQFDINGDLKSSKEFQSINDTLIEDKKTQVLNGEDKNSITFTCYYENNNIQGLYPMEFIKSVNGDDKKVLYRLYTQKSKDFPNKLDFYYESKGIVKNQISTKKDANGSIISTKDLGYKDTKIIQEYKENTNIRKNLIKIIDRQNNTIFESDIKHIKIDENHYETIENGVKYSIEYLPDRVLITRENEETIELSIGDNDVNAFGILSKDLLPLIKKLPGSTLYNIHKYGAQKIWQNENKRIQNNAMFKSTVNKIELSKYYSSEEKLFVLLHEIGHFMDYHKLRNNKELNEIFKQEKAEFKKIANDTEYNSLSYLIDSAPIATGGISGEFVAETYAILHSINQSPEVEVRGILLQQYFKRTFAKVAELLLKD